MGEGYPSKDGRNVEKGDPKVLGGRRGRKLFWHGKGVQAQRTTSAKTPWSGARIAAGAVCGI